MNAVINGKRGSITVEASIVLPIFICVIISIVFFIKVVITHEIIQHAITETAHELSTISYIYHISGLQEAHDSIRDGMEGRARLFEDHVSTVFDAYGDLNRVKETADIAGEIIENPAEELKNFACMIAAGAFEDIKTEVCIPLVELYIQKYLKTGEAGNADIRLKKLSVINGLNGLDFSESSFFEDENNDIDLIVRYRMDIPVPVKILPRLLMVQRVTVKAWLGGDDADGYSGYYGQVGQSGPDEQGEDIWSLGNFQRGRRIRAIFGANLPDSFPGISKFETGTATLIKSMDLTANSYQDEEAVREKVSEYVRGLAKYQGQEEPWGRRGIVIRRSEIESRCLILVIPQNTVASEVMQSLDECARDAAAEGVDLRIVKYGYKMVSGADDTSDIGGEQQ